MAENITTKDFFAEHGVKIAGVFLVVVIAVAATVHFIESKKGTDAVQAELIGKGLNYVYTGKNDSALVELESLIQGNKVSGLALAKVSLLAGNIKYQNGDMDGAAVLFQKSLDNAGSTALIRAGAMHGRAAVAMEKKDYAAAANLLEKFVDEFGERTGDLEDRYTKSEPADLVPTVPDALWKLTLVYTEMGAKDKAKASAEKILTIYGDNAAYSDKAKKYLAAL
jgi:tetratricopeptide (TPR) repeat protein